LKSFKYLKLKIYFLTSKSKTLKSKVCRQIRFLSTLAVIIFSSGIFGQQGWAQEGGAKQDILDMINIEIDEQVSVSARDIIDNQTTSMKFFVGEALNHPLLKKYLGAISNRPLNIRIIHDLEGGLFDDAVSPLECGRSSQVRHIGINLGKSLVIEGNWKNVLAHEVFHYVHFLVNPDEPTWMREGLAQYFEHQVTKRPPGQIALAALQAIQTPLMGDYKACQINEPQYGHDFWFFDFVARNCGGVGTIDEILKPSTIKGEAKLTRVLSHLTGVPAVCRDFRSLALAFEVARAHNQMVFAKTPSFLAGETKEDFFLVWPVGQFLKPLSLPSPNIEKLSLFEPLILDEGVRTVVASADFEVFWLEQDSPYSILKTKTPPNEGRFRQLIIRTK
jgi:hypothetical protein